ncbi:MAG: tryptophan synthase subunit alpha [Acidobacteria bacterium]|nr:tryptophan synthase subunit alpha [Acidobacteriota bacterium]
MSSRITQLFDRLRPEGRKALIAYITAGDPAPERTPALVAALERGGADLIELGVPFSDPVADGPVIQRASSRAIAAGGSFARTLEIAREIRERSGIPILLFTYLNPMLRYGVERAARDARAAGVDGILLTDLSVEEAGASLQAFREAALDTVFLAAPTSTDRRMGLVAEYCRGFVYLVSRAGVTGEQDSISASLGPLIARARRATALPLAAGFGISTPAQARQVAEMAEGVVVGSAFVRMIEKLGGPELEPALEAFARELKTAMEAKQ